MYILESDILKYVLDETGRVVSIVNKQNNHEYVHSPGEIFRVIYAIEDFDERSIRSGEQNNPVIIVNGNKISVHYDKLVSMDGILDISLTLSFVMENEKLSVIYTIINNSDVEVKEIQITAFSGILTLGKDPKRDNLIIPRTLGQKIPNPTQVDFYQYINVSGRKYEKRDQIQTSISAPYPGFCSMQWFSMYNENESVYIGNHDEKCKIICMHIEKATVDKTLRLGICHYPFLKKGDSRTSNPIVYAIFEGDWHQCARYYRKWMEEDLNWKPSVKPKWVEEFQGWLRVIFRTQSGEFNYHFKDIPQMFDELQDAGLNTLFMLGWPKGGFARMRPEYTVNPKHLDDLKAGIDYVHSKGGKIIMFVSYRVVDRQSNYYTMENGSEVLIKDIWNGFVKYSETYSSEGSYRKVLNLPKDQYCACSGSDRWHEKMKETADYCMSLGADAVLYDLGGTRPLLCTAKNHDHKYPDEARSSRPKRFKGLRENIKRYGDKAIMQEHCIDVYTPYMDLVQPNKFEPRNNNQCPEMFMYTFPEVIMTNRENALDEENMYDNINYTFLYNLKFDLSIARCCATPSFIPDYCKYMKKVLEIRREYSEYLKDGLFCDEEGFETEGINFRHKAYRTKDGKLGIALWNFSNEKATQKYVNTETGKEAFVTLKKDEICFREL